MAEERNVEGVIVGVDGGQWTTTALIQTDDGTQVQASFSDIDQELVEPERFRQGTKIRLDVPAPHTTLQAEHIHSGRPTFYEVPARRPFAHPRQAEWIDGAGRAHPMVRDVGHQAQDIHPGWDQVESHPIYSDPQGPYGDRIAAEPPPASEETRTNTLNETEREGENVEGVIVGLEVDEWQTTALIETDDRIRVEVPFSHDDLVAPKLFREGTRIRLDVPLRYMHGETVQGPDGEVIDLEPQDRRPFAVPNSAEWIDSGGQAHALVVDSHQVATAENNQREKARTMTSVGKKTVQGNLTADPRPVHTKAGQDMVVFKMAEDHRRFNENSRQWEDSDPTFYDVAVDRDRLGANVLSSLHKGDRVTVSGNYQVNAYSTSTGQPGLNHRIWAEDVAASMQYNPVKVLTRDRDRNPEASLTQSHDQSMAQSLHPDKMTPEEFTSWASQNPVTVPGAQQGGPGFAR